MPQDFERRYKVYALGVPSDRPQPWERSVWRQIENELAFLNEVCRGPIALRGCYQEVQDDGYYKERGYGRLAWQSRSSDKWTYENPEDEGRELDRKFAYVNAWGPHWNKCIKEEKAPDFYLSLSNDFPAPRYKNHMWRGELLLAISLDLPEAALGLFTASVHYIAGVLGCSYMGQQEMPWAVQTANIAGFQVFETPIRDCSPYTAEAGSYQRPAHEALRPEWRLVAIAV